MDRHHVAGAAAVRGLASAVALVLGLSGCTNGKAGKSDDAPARTEPADGAAAAEGAEANAADGSGGVLGPFARAQVRSACVEMLSLEHAVQMYQVMKRGKCPESVEALKAAGIVAKVPRDPWKKDYLLECKGEDVTLRSGGLDGVLGNADDLAVGADLAGCEAPEREAERVETKE